MVINGLCEFTAGYQLLSSNLWLVGVYGRYNYTT